METYMYKCPVCGFTHQVPAYWVSYSPEETYESPHMNLTTGQMCEEMELQLSHEETT